MGAVRGICAHIPDKNYQYVVLDNAKDVIDEAGRMMQVRDLERECSVRMVRE